MAAFEAAVSDRPGGPAVDASEVGADALRRPAGGVGDRRVCGPAASHLTDPLSLGGDDIYVVHGSQVTPPPGPDPSVNAGSRRIRSPQGVSSACRVGAAIGGPYELVGFERSDVVPRCAPDLRGGWAGDRAGSHARIGALFLLLGVVLLGYVVQLVVAGELSPETGEGPIGVLLAFDHSMFIGVMTNVLFALVARTGHVRASSAVLWGVNVGLVVFLAGLVADIPILERIGAPVMGLALLAGVAVLFRQASAPRPVPVV